MRILAVMGCVVSCLTASRPIGPRTDWRTEPLLGGGRREEAPPPAAPPPQSPPCLVATPSGFKPAPQQGSWADPSCPVDPKTGTNPCAKPNIEHRHGVSVECCAEYCAADPECQGFQVFEPCGISDCYAYHKIEKSAFTPHNGSYSFSWGGARPPVHPISAGCASKKSWNPGYPFTWKCRVASVAAAPGPPPAAPVGPLPRMPETTTWSLGSSHTKSNGTEWSEEGSFTAADAAKAQRWSAIASDVRITTLGVTSVPPIGTNGSLTNVECQITLLSPQASTLVPVSPHGGDSAGGTITIKGLLFGGTLGLMLSTNASLNPRMSVPVCHAHTTAPIVLTGESSKLCTRTAKTNDCTYVPQVLTKADFNNERYYSKAFDGLQVPTPPRKFAVVDSCDCGDTDWYNWNACISALSSAGMSAVGTDVQNPFILKLLAANSVNYTSGGIYAPPGAEPDTGLTLNTSYMATWAKTQFARFDAAGFKPTQLKTFALADEPGWYLPAESPEHFMNVSMGASAVALKAEWAAFLAKNKVVGLSPSVMPLTDRWQLKGLVAKKLFYWSSRFSSYSAAAAFARATAAVETATVKGAPIYVNFVRS